MKPVNSPGFDRLWWFTANSSELFIGTRCTIYFSCNMHRYKSPSYKKTCRKAPGFIFYKHKVKERTFYQDSHETGPKHEETARTRATLLEIGRYGRKDGSMRAPSVPIFCFDFQQKALEQIVFSGTSPMCENLSQLGLQVFVSLLGMCQPRAGFVVICEPLGGKMSLWWQYSIEQCPLLTHRENLF